MMLCGRPKGVDSSLPNQQSETAKFSIIYSHNYPGLSTISSIQIHGTLYSAVQYAFPGGFWICYLSPSSFSALSKSGGLEVFFRSIARTWYYRIGPVIHGILSVQARRVPPSLQTTQVQSWTDTMV